jgi:DNA-directed RNA polymerase subunit RPC12/RpoP
MVLNFTIMAMLLVQGVRDKTGNIITQLFRCRGCHRDFVPTGIVSIADGDACPFCNSKHFEAVTFVQPSNKKPI